VSARATKARNRSRTPLAAIRSSQAHAPSVEHHPRRVVAAGPRTRSWPRGTTPRGHDGRPSLSGGRRRRWR
jgi:hypothetical protein